MATSEALGVSSLLLTSKGEHFSYKLVFSSSCSEEHKTGSGGETEPLEVSVCHPTTAAQRYSLEPEERNGERADFGDVKSQVMPLASCEGSDSVSLPVDSVNKMHLEKDSMNRAR